MDVNRREKQVEDRFSPLLRVGYVLCFPEVSTAQVADRAARGWLA